MSAAPRPALAASTPTRALLVSAALAAVQTGMFLALLPVLAAAAPAAPPLYALLASANTAMPLLARILTRATGTATITAGITAIMVVAFSPIGLLSAVPLLTAGIVFDLVTWKGPVSTRRLTVGAAAVAVALFAISLAAFSPEHLTPFVLTATLAGRLIGESVVAVLVSTIARMLRRAGVGR
ncbi:hypothetical protein [Microbacterium aurantiacum]|uniref:hypothetical protein n=1 Tax=Microbacterium aurantiacum TaxID=162393 RepID=UPI000C808C2E|nr:hypothetical protein [Microbacterium aurantiacum]